MLYGQEMATIVHNRDEFTLWWSRLHQVFYEARDPNTTPDEKNWKKQYEVPEVRELVLGQRANNLNVLRNWVNHDFQTRQASSHEAVSRILTSFIDRSRLEDGDQLGWRQLQRRVLEELCELSVAVSSAFEKAHAAKSRALATGQSAPAHVDKPGPDKKPTAPSLIFLDAPPL